MSSGQLLHELLGKGAGPDDRVLATFASTGEEVTRRGLRTGAEEVAAGLSARGVAAGDRVAIQLDNRVEYLEAVFAASMLGAIVCHVHTAAKGHMLERALSLTRPVGLIAGEDAADRVAPLALAEPPWIATVGGPPAAGGVAFEELRLGGGAAPPPAMDRSAAVPICIYSSSGTTGPAKGVTLSHAALFEMAHTAQIVMGYRPTDVAYTVTPFYHANALVFMFLATCLAGGHTVFAERFSPSRFWQDVDRFGATRSSLVGSATALLQTRPAAAEDAENAMELVAAVPRPKDAAAFEARFGVKLTEFYGSTEANLPIGIPIDAWESNPERTCGRALPGWECRIAAEDGLEAAVGDEGQLLVRPGRPGVVSSGYWGESERTVELWKDLWIQTGDLMRRDADGWFYYVDRLKDAIRVSGENVASADVEFVVAEFPGVSEAAAYGVPSELGEQDIMVAVVMAADSVLDAAEVRDHCEARLPYFAVPRYFVGVEALPRTPTERVRKVALRERGVTDSTVDLGRPRRRK